MNRKAAKRKKQVICRRFMKGDSVNVPKRYVTVLEMHSNASVWKKRLKFCNFPKTIARKYFLNKKLPKKVQQMSKFS